MHRLVLRLFAYTGKNRKGKTWFPPVSKLVSDRRYLHSLKGNCEKPRANRSRINAARSNRCFYPIIIGPLKNRLVNTNRSSSRFWLRLRWDGIERLRCKNFGRKQNLFAFLLRIRLRSDILDSLNSKLSRYKIIYFFLFFFKRYVMKIILIAFEEVTRQSLLINKISRLFDLINETWKQREKTFCWNFSMIMIRKLSTQL